MKMRIKGFTLVELLASIVILGVVIGIAVPTFLTISNSAKKKAYDNKIGLIKNAAVKYASENNILNDSISVHKLVLEGYLQADNADEVYSDEPKNVVNPIDGGYLDCKILNISYDSEYYVNISDNDECSIALSDEKQSIIDISAYEYENGNVGNFLGKNDNISWTNKNVLLVATFEEGKTRDSSIIWSISGNSVKNNDGEVLNDIFATGDKSNYANTYIVDVETFMNGEVNIQTTINGVLVSKNINVKIDKEKPFGSYSAKEEWDKEGKSVVIVGSDGDGSGVSKYILKRDNIAPTVNDFVSALEYDSDTNKNSKSLKLQGGKWYYYVIDNVGNISDAIEIDIHNIDDGGPSLLYPINRNGWSRDDYTIQFGCGSDTMTGCKEKVTYSIYDMTNNVYLAENVTENNRIVNYVVKAVDNKQITAVRVTWSAWDNLDNESVQKDFQVNTYIDRLNPTCVSQGGSNIWTKDNVTIKGICSDSGSGCKGNVSNFITTDTNKNVSPGDVYDNVGNKTTCSAVTVKIDKTAPTCTTSTTSSGWTNKNVTITGKCSDSGSGCSKDASRSFTSETNSKQSPGSVSDNVGNTRECPSIGVYIDKTAPTCTTTTTSSGWTNQNVTITGKCNDTGGSGCSKNVSRSFISNINSWQSPGSVSDNAGNSKNCDGIGVYVDKTAPTCTTSTTSSGWTNQNVTITGTCSDSGGSGCSGNASRSFTSDTNSSQSPGSVKDNAGNSVNCNSIGVYVDKTAPTCTTTTTSNGWTNQNVTITGKCSDSGSGCAGNASRSFTSETNSNQSPGSVKDKVGNTSVCPSIGVYIDKTPPTCTTSGGNTWRKPSTTSLTIYGTCSDSGGSGCRSNVSKTYSGPTREWLVKLDYVYDNAGNSNFCDFKQDVFIDQHIPYTPYIYDIVAYNNVTLYGFSCSISSNTFENITCNVSMHINPNTKGEWGVYLNRSDTYGQDSSGNWIGVAGAVEDTYYRLMKNCNGNGDGDQQWVWGTGGISIPTNATHCEVDYRYRDLVGLYSNIVTIVYNIS